MKRLILFFTILLISICTWASNVITYTASSKLTQTTSNSSSGLHTNAFNVSISSHTFSNGTGTITFGGEVTSIGNSAFYGCYSLTSITIPNSVTSFGDDAFEGCTGLTSVTIPNSVTSIGNYAFFGCSGLTSVTIPNSVTSIGNSAFEGCSGLTSITIPNSVTSIGDAAFYGCKGLTSITIPISVTSIGSEAFYGCKGLTSITIPNSVTSIGRSAFYGCSSLTSITIPNSVTSIGDRAFYGCSGLTSVTIPNSVTSIEGLAFYNCSGLTSITIPNSVTSIGNYAFRGCSGLTSVTIPNSVASIGSSAFENCSSLTSITIPNSVTSIGDRAFYECANLKTVYDDSNLNITKGETNNGYVGYYADNIYNGIRVGDFVVRCDTLLTTYLGYGGKIVIPASVTNIGKEVFQNCSNLTEVTLPNALKYIGNYAFYNCSNMTSLTLPSKVSTIGDYAFYGCNNRAFTKLVMPQSVKTIGDYAFANCNRLTSVNFSNDLEEVGDYAFSGCTRINDMTCYALTTPDAYEHTFSGVNSMAYLYVQAGSARTYKLDPYWGVFDIHEIGADSTTVVGNSVQVVPSDNEAEFTWPTNNDAQNYTLTITKDGVAFCTLTFNASGMLTNIAFAPGRNAANHTQTATTSAAGMSFTVTGLDGASKYAYNLATTGVGNTVLVSYSGEFATTGYQGEVNPGGTPDDYTAVDIVNTGVNTPTKVVRDGHVLILRGDRLYDLQGQEVR